MSMTPEAKSQLATTIRTLRSHLVGSGEDQPGALHDAVERAYRMSVRARDAGLGEAARIRRKRLEDWIEEQVRIDSNAPQKKAAKGGDASEGLRARFRREVEKQAAYTLVNRLVMLRLLEATPASADNESGGRPLRSPEVVARGVESAGYKAFRALAPALVRNDETEGYAFLLGLVFDELAVDLPGLFGPAGAADLVPLPPATLQHVIKELDDKALASCWTDDMTLGWVYQYWNDPEREAIDAKLNAGGKVEPHEIASKTQMFTERYMVDWLLQNSLGPMWFAMCRKHGWTPDVEKHGVLDALEERRVAWRKKRDDKEVSLIELMPLHSAVERRWAYFLPQPIPEDAIESAPATVRALKILDPAVGSGHFLVVAFDLLFALYEEEARHRGESDRPEWQRRAIVESILENNLHGIDLDPRAVQIAAAALWLKAKQTCADAEPAHLNLVASALRLAGLPDDDAALVELRREVEKDTGIPGNLVDNLVHALRGADHLGSLLKVDKAVDEAIASFERGDAQAEPVQASLFGAAPPPQQLRMDAATARASVLDSLEKFLHRHTRSDELGLRLHGEQLAMGVRFVRMVREGTYDLVVGNPPYQGTAKMRDAAYVQKHYPRGKADLYAAFLERGLQLARKGGTSALLTMRNWMFIKQFAELRKWLLEMFDLRAIGDFAVGAFDEVPNDVLSVSAGAFRRGEPSASASVALQPTRPDDRSYDRERTKRKRAATIAGTGRHEFKLAALRVVPEWPLLYWWPATLVDEYAASTKIGEAAPVRQGLITADNLRFLRLPWEVTAAAIWIQRDPDVPNPDVKWVPYIKGGEGLCWIEPASCVVNWHSRGLEIRGFERDGKVLSRPQNMEYYFVRGIAYSPIGNSFAAREHRHVSIFDSMGASVFSDSRDATLCSMNSAKSRLVLESLNPSVHFQVGDVNRLPIFPIQDATEIVRRLRDSFADHEAHREASPESRRPGASTWGSTQRWAQSAVDRTQPSLLPAFNPTSESEPRTDHLSFALGIALGRFGANGEGILDPATANLTHTLPAGICFLDGTLDTNDHRDSLGHPASTPILTAWKQHGAAIAADTDVRSWLRLRFFPDVHKGMYENRPIHWPLSSSNKTFVAFINIHRWNEDTLRVLLADHLRPALTRLDGELVDLRAARDGADKKAARNAEKRFAQVKKAQEELVRFVADVEQCAERGALPMDAKSLSRERDARYAPDLDDGVMINSAALWPLLEPQWKDPKKWWKELSTPAGKKDYDWSHLAMRYWPSRVDAKCKVAPSLGVAHGCFWTYHPARAFAWELRLQDEIGPDFRIVEKPYDPFGNGGDGGDADHRVRWLADHPDDALAAVEKEVLRRLRKHKKPQTEMRLLDAGLWTARPAECWAMELFVSEKQGVEMFLRAPDAPTAREEFLRKYPDEVKRRLTLVNSLKPTDLVGLVANTPDEESSAGEDDSEDQAEEAR